MKDNATAATRQDPAGGGAPGSAGACVLETALGHVALAWGPAGLTRCVLPQRDRRAALAGLARGGRAADLTEESALPTPIAELTAGIRAYAAGEPVDFSRVAIDFGDADDFRRAIYAAARRLGHGEVVTYGELAARAGHPGAARETGTALGRNPVPLVVPCHRIVAAGGRIGGFSAPGGAETKKRLLAHERAAPPGADPAQGAFAF